MSDVEMFPVCIGRSLAIRFQRKIGSKPYSLYEPKVYRDSLRARLAKGAIDVVFLNKAELVRFAPLIAELAPKVQVVVLSHGNESGDLLYEWSVRQRTRNPLADIRRAAVFGRLMMFEARVRLQQRLKFCVLSEEEATLERWLGGQEVMVLPPIVAPDPLDWRPVVWRAGFIGTLNHTPNRVAIESLCALVSERPAKVEIEIVGAPEEIGKSLASQFPFVHYLGALADPECRQVASNWSLFLNPVFWLSRGASMKLGQALSWGLPTLTTRSGRRGYDIPAGAVIECTDHKVDFAESMLSSLAHPEGMVAVRRCLLECHPGFPSTKVVAERMRQWLTDRCAGVAQKWKQ